MNVQKIMKDGVKLNDPITVELPAHIWLTFINQYQQAEWMASGANYICRAAQVAIYDPIWVSEQEAAMQAHIDQQQGVFNHVMGLQQDIPPNMEEPNPDA